MKRRDRSLISGMTAGISRRKSGSMICPARSAACRTENSIPEQPIAHEQDGAARGVRLFLPGKFRFQRAPCRQNSSGSVRGGRIRAADRPDRSVRRSTPSWKFWRFPRKNYIAAFIYPFLFLSLPMIRHHSSEDKIWNLYFFRDCAHFRELKSGAPDPPMSPWISGHLKKSI